MEAFTTQLQIKMPIINQFKNRKMIVTKISKNLELLFVTY
jgi:hypothetical protein